MPLIDLNDTRKSILPFHFETKEEFPNIVFVSTLTKTRTEIVSKTMAEGELARPDLPLEKRRIYQKVLEVLGE